VPVYLSSFAKPLHLLCFNYCDRWRETWSHVYFLFVCIYCDFARIWSGKCNHNVAACPIYRLLEDFQFFFALLMLQSRISASNNLIRQCRRGIILTRSDIFALSVNCSVLSLKQIVTHNIHLCCDIYINSSRNNLYFQNLWVHPNEKEQNEWDYLPIELLFTGENALGYECVLRLGVPSFWRPK
jgi:hypothetical protein